MSNAVNNNAKKVLIACPTLGIDPDPQRWLASLVVILNNVRREGFTHALFCPYRQTWWSANNEIWDVAFANKFDYILRIDDDIHGVPVDAFSKLLAADKTVIGAAYPNRRYPYTVQALIWKSEEKNFIKAYASAEGSLESIQFHGYKGRDIQKVDLLGFGMTLIKVAPFKFFERPMYKGEENCPDDTYFAQICQDNGISQYVHWGVRINHAHVTFANSGHLFNAYVLERRPDLLEKPDEVLLAEALPPQQKEEYAKT